MGKSRKGSSDIVFAGSKKAKLFNSEGIEDKSIEAVGGINGVLGARFKKAGVCTAKDLSCKMREMTKRNYLRYVMKVLLLGSAFFCKPGPGLFIQARCSNDMA